MGRKPIAATATETVPPAVVDGAAATAALETTATATEAAPPSVYAQILAAVKVATPDFAEMHAKEDVQTFVKRLARAVSDLDEPSYAALSTEVTTWFDKVADQISEKVTVDLPAGMPTAVAATAVAPAKRTGAQALAEINAKRKADKEAAAAAAAANGTAVPVAAKVAKEPKAPKEVKVKEPRAEGVVAFMRKLVISNHEISLEDMCTAAVAKGHEAKQSTAAAVRTDTMSTIKLVKELGMWKA